MKITALGTGTSQGIPLIGCKCAVCQSKDSADSRLRSSIYVQTEQSKILIDIGPDFRWQFLSNKIDTVDLVLITHEHNDHIIGLDDIRAINFTQQKSIPFMASSRVAADIRSRFDYAFAKVGNPAVPSIDLKIIEDKRFEFKDVSITPINVMHGSLPIWGYRINDLVYITDASAIPEEEYDKMKGVKVLIINALRHSSHYSHFSLAEALEVIEKIGAEKNYISHISHQMGLTAEWSSTLPDNVSPLNDKMIIVI